MEIKIIGVKEKDGDQDYQKEREGWRSRLSEGKRRMEIKIIRRKGEGWRSRLLEKKGEGWRSSLWGEKRRKKNKTKKNIGQDWEKQKSEGIKER